MDLLYLGYVVDKESCDDLIGASVAGNNMQLGVLEELHNIMGSRLNVISIYPTAAYPKAKKLLVRKEERVIFPRQTAIFVPFLNVPIIKQVWTSLSVYFMAKNFISENRNCKILTFNAFPHVGLAAKWLSKKYGIESVCLLADLPIDVINRNIISKLFRKIFDNLTLKCIISYSKLIVLNKNAAIRYAPGKPYLLIDGGISIKADSKARGLNETLLKHKEKIVLFAGTLNEYNGIPALIEAMKYVKNNDVRLHIYGTGPLKNFVVEKAEEIPNIEYKGSVGNEKMRSIQAEADLLINPRPINDPVSQVTFPSKLIEYMLSGTAVLTSKLSGLTQEYFERVYLLEDTDALSIAKDIEEVLGLPPEDLANTAKKAREFIINNKLWSIQTKKIYEFIN